MIPYNGEEVKLVWRFVYAGGHPAIVRPVSSAALPPAVFPALPVRSVRLRSAFHPSHTWDPAEAARLGRELRSPVAVGDVTWRDKADTAPRPLGEAGALMRADIPQTSWRRSCTGTTAQAC